MKNLRTLFLDIAAASLFATCSDDDAVVIDPPVSTLSGASLLLESIREDGGISYDVDNPTLTFTAAQNVFLPSVLGIDFRTDRSIVPAGPTARFPLFQGWETTSDGPSRCYYVITQPDESVIGTQIGSPRNN